LIFFGNFIVS